MSKDKFPSKFSPQMEAIVLNILQIFFENWWIFSDIPQFLQGIIRSRDALRPIARERKVLMDYKQKYLTIRLWARDFYEVIVDEAEGRINYRLIEIESE